MPRLSHVAAPTPNRADETLQEDSFVDEFGFIAPQVYQSLQRIAPVAFAFAARIGANDEAETHRQLMRAAALVTRQLEESDEIENVSGYLLQTFKNLLIAEYRREKHRAQLLAEHCATQELQSLAEIVERRILLDELVRAMDAWTRRVFRSLTLDYSFNQIADSLHSSPHAVREKYKRRINNLLERLDLKAHKADSSAAN